MHRLLVGHIELGGSEHAGEVAETLLVEWLPRQQFRVVAIVGVVGESHAVVTHLLSDKYEDVVQVVEAVVEVELLTEIISARLEACAIHHVALGQIVGERACRGVACHEVVEACHDVVAVTVLEIVGVGIGRLILELHVIVEP